MTTITFTDALAFVQDQASDAEIDLLFDGLRERRKTLSKRAAAENVTALKTGDPVKLKGLSPKLLNGATGKVGAISGTTITVELDDTPENWRAKARSGSSCRVPAQCVEKI